MSLRFGLIGTGGGGHLFAGALAGRPGGARLVSVCSRNRRKAADFGAGYGVTEIHTDWRDLIRSDIDAVCLASPTGDHARMAIAAAAEGRHVLTEKPIATTVADADRMIEACEDAGVTLGCIYMYRFLETARRMKDAIADGMIGRPLMAECTGPFYRDQPYYDSGEWRGKWESEGGGSLVTQTSHTLDLMLWMLGDVEEALALYSTSPLHRIEVEDITV
ncbi:MAG: Gfo/Idh/MocA family oxidoreductase, partial [bacterium]|nr:Gfo/Idh/MocA family oxidoreductase [bacterium]